RLLDQVDHEPDDEEDDEEEPKAADQARLPEAGGERRCGGVGCHGGRHSSGFAGTFLCARGARQAFGPTNESSLATLAARASETDIGLLNRYSIPSCRQLRQKSSMMS